MNETLRAPRLHRFPLGADSTIVHVPATGIAATLPSSHAELAASCDAFRTPLEHARRFCAARHLDPTNATALARDLVSLAEAGLLITHDGTLDAARRHSRERGGDELPAMTTIGIPTRSRPDLVERCVASHAAGARDAGKHAAFLVVDGELDPTAADLTRARLAAVAAREQVQIAYVTRGERNAFAEALAREAGVAVELTRWAIEGDPAAGTDAGAHRNAIALACAGERILCVDDDTQARFAAAEEATRDTRLRLLGDRPPVHALHFGDDGDAERAHPATLGDPFAPHDALLGRLGAECVARSRGAFFDRESARLVEGISLGRARVVVTALGVLGDVGATTSSGLLLATGSTRDALVASERAWRRSTTSREVLRRADAVTITEAAYCQSMHLGIDTRALLAPFSPVYRSQDAVFAALVATTDRDALFGHPSSAVLHRPANRAPFAEEQVKRASAPTVCGVLANLVNELGAEIRSDDASSRTQAVARRLLEIASDDLASTVRHLHWRTAGRMIDHAEQALARHHRAPSFWARDVEHFIAATRESVTTDGAHWPSDLRCADEDREKVLAAFLRRFAELAEAWPALVGAARRLRARGALLGG